MLKLRLSGTVAMGLLCAAVGAIAALLLAVIATGSGWEAFFVAAPLSAFATGAFFWWLLMARRNHLGTARGVIAGALAGAVSHLVCWYFFFVIAFACNVFTGGCRDSLDQPPVNPLLAVPAASIYSGVSLMLCGWLTVPAGGLLGGLLAIARRRAVAGQAPDPSLQRTSHGCSPG
jgi:hypothetical protein